jgi:hypothetical protein
MGARSALAYNIYLGSDYLSVSWNLHATPIQNKSRCKLNGQKYFFEITAHFQWEKNSVVTYLQLKTHGSRYQSFVKELIILTHT